jgi:hypothetical protein
MRNACPAVQFRCTTQRRPSFCSPRPKDHNAARHFALHVQKTSSSPTLPGNPKICVPCQLPIYSLLSWSKYEPHSFNLLDLYVTPVMCIKGPSIPFSVVPKQFSTGYYGCSILELMPMVCLLTRLLCPPHWNRDVNLDPPFKGAGRH